MNSSADHKYVIKIADFGLSRAITEGKKYYTATGSAFPVKW